MVKIDPSATFSHDSSGIYFVAHATAWTKGKNSWFIMPIEGKTKFLHNNLSLYFYQIQEQKAFSLFDLGFVPYALDGWRTSLIPSEIGVSMTIEPLQGWDAEPNRHGVVQLKEKLNKVFIIDTLGQLSHATSHFPDNSLGRVDMTHMRSIVRDLPYATFGLNLKEINPASEKEYVKALTSLTNTTNYRRLIIEQVVSQKDKETIREIYGRMREALEKLVGNEKNMMELFSKENFEMMENMMEE